MEAANQQRILGFFIEEAKEHLETLERGILELPAVVEDAERVNEMFRAAHSVKGGGAMLGYGSIQKAAHRLEDAFKCLKENTIPIDQKLVSLFLEGYDILRELIEQIQNPLGLQDERAEEILKRGEPIFRDLQGYLQVLLTPEPVPSPADKLVPTPSLPQDWGVQARELLRQMLDGFRQEETPESRQQLLGYCQQLSSLGPAEKGWQALLESASAAIANPQHDYQTLAPVVIQELKQGSDCLELERGDSIAPSGALQQLAASPWPQILVTLEPNALAHTLRQVLNRQQLSHLLELLS